MSLDENQLNYPAEPDVDKISQIIGNASRFIVYFSLGFSYSRKSVERTWLSQLLGVFSQSEIFPVDCLVDAKQFVFAAIFSSKGSPSCSQFFHQRKSYSLNFRHPGDKMRWSTLLTGSFYEQEMLTIRATYSGGDIIDIGANIGNHSVFFDSIAKSDSRVFCFEPDNVAFKILESNISSNVVDLSRVCIFNEALGDNYGYATLDNGSSSNLGASRIIATSPSSDSVDASEASSPLKPLDEYLDTFTRPSIVKVDVEGFEEKVLRGATKLIERFKPVFYIEAKSPDDLAAVLDILSPFGYTKQGKFNDTPTYKFVADTYQPAPAESSSSDQVDSIDGEHVEANVHLSKSIDQHSISSERIASLEKEAELILLQLHQLQEELEYYYNLSCEQAKLLDKSNLIQNKAIALLADSGNRI